MENNLVTILGKPKVVTKSHGLDLLVSGYECSCGCSVFALGGYRIEMSPYSIFPNKREISCFDCCSIYFVPDDFVHQVTN